MLKKSNNYVLLNVNNTFKTIEAYSPWKETTVKKVYLIIYNHLNNLHKSNCLIIESVRDNALHDCSWFVDQVELHVLTKCPEFSFRVLCYILKITSKNNIILSRTVSSLFKFIVLSIITKFLRIFWCLHLILILYNFFLNT